MYSCMAIYILCYVLQVYFVVMRNVFGNCRPSMIFDLKVSAAALSVFQSLHSLDLHSLVSCRCITLAAHGS